MKKLLSAVSILVALTACKTTEHSVIPNALEINAVEKNHSPKNIIMVVADGMGPAYTTSYRYFNDDPTTPLIEERYLTVY